MDPVYVPLLSALAGAIIGSLSSIATILIQDPMGKWIATGTLAE
jgi:hypothetical protein